MRLTTGMRGCLAAAAFLTTLIAGVAGAAAPDPVPRQARTDSKAAASFHAGSGGSDSWSLAGSGDLQLNAVQIGNEPAKGVLPQGAPAHVPASLRYAPQPFGQGYAGEAEPNGSSATATPIVGSNAVVRATLWPAGDVDFYSFQANAGDKLYAATMTSFSVGNSSDSQITVLDSDGATVIEFDDDNGSFATLSSTIAGATLPANGTYFIKVNDFTPGTGSERSYELHFRLQSGAPTPEAESNDTPATANPLPANGWVSGTRNPAAATEQDWYSLNLNAGDTVFLSLDLDPERDGIVWNGRLGFALFGDASNQILVVDDAGTGDVSPLPNIPSEAMFFTVKQAGTYFAFVDSSSAAVGGPTATYNLSVSVHPAADEGVNCTTYTSADVPKTIGPGAGLVSSTITVPGNPVIADVDVSIVLNHALMQDVDAHLRSPAGNDIGLFSDIGSAATGGQQQLDVTFDDEAGIPPSFTAFKGAQLKPEVAYRLGWLDGENAGGTWTLDLRDDTAGANGGTLTSWSLRVCEAPPPPACPPGFGPTTVYSTDFESGAAGFTHSGTADEWELGLPATVATTTANPVAGFTTCASGTNCWKTDLDNTYDASSSQDLLSPAINLAGVSAPVVVSWSQRYQMESATNDHYNVDFRQVGGATPVRVFEWLDGTMTDAPGNPAANIGASAGWSRVSARVDSLAGLNTELAFHLDSNASINFGGVAIDDVSVTACRALSADLVIIKTDGVSSATPGGSVTYSIGASNPLSGDPVTGATVADTFPAALTCTWTCVGAAGGTCTASGSGNINDAVNLPPGGAVTYTAACAISASATGTLANTAIISSSIADPTPANNSSTDTDMLTPQADLAITKTDGVTSVVAGGSAIYTITASNAGPSNATGATVADTFPAVETCTWTCVGAGGGTCTAAGSGNIADTVNLPAGGSVTHTASCAVSSAASGTLSNTATVAVPAGVTDPAPGNNSATDTDTVLVPALLSGTKTASGTFTIGSTVSYTVVLNNGGGAQADNPGDEFTDVLPPELTLVSATATSGTAIASIGTNTVTWNGAIAPGGSATITIDATIEPGASGDIANQGSISYDANADGSNEASASTDDPDTGAANDPTVFTVVPTADLSITKTDGVTSAIAGGTTTYTIAATNAGPFAATGATVTDTFPAALSCSWTCAGTGGGTCAAAGSGNIGGTVDLPAGASAVYTATCTIDSAATGSLVNTATVASPAGLTDPDPANNSATDTDALGAAADLSITKTNGSGSVAAGGTTTYTIVASNAGPSAATGATIADALPASLTCTWTCAGAAGGSCTAAGSGSISDTINLPPGGSATYTAACSIGGGASGTLSNTATIAAPAGVTDTNPANNSATDADTVIVPSALTATKTASGSFLPNGNVVYTIVLNNGGGAQADNPGDEFNDVLPASLTLVSATATAGTAIANLGGNSVTWNGAIPGGSSVTITINATIAASASGSISNQGAIHYDADGNGTNESSGVTDDPATPAANDATTFAVGASADLSISKTDGVATVQAGTSSTYTIVVANAGPSAVSGASVSDAFPAQCTAPSWTCAANGGGSCPASGSGNIAANVDLPAGASATFTASCAVGAGVAAGTVITNTAQVAAPADSSDPDPANNSASDTTTVSAAPVGAAISGSKTVGGDFVEGGAVSYTIVLSNGGGAQADNPGDEFSDVLPAQLALVSASASSGTAVANPGSNTVTWNGAIAAGGSVTITIQATIVAGASGQISNQGSIRYDGDADGSNETGAPTDDPATVGAGDATTFRIAGAAALPTPVPGLGSFGLLLLALGFVLIGSRRAHPRQG